MIDEIIASFKQDQHFSPDVIVGRCHLVSSAFRDVCQKAGINTTSVFLMDYIGEPFPDIHPEWEKADFLVHSVVLIDNTVYDFTYRQFVPDAPVPFISSLDDVKRVWETVSLNP